VESLQLDIEMHSTYVREKRISVRIFIHIYLRIPTYPCVYIRIHTPHKSTPKNGQQKHAHIFMGYTQRSVIYARSGIPKQNSFGH